MRRNIYNLTMDYTFFIIFCIVCVDRGDGHWKEKERENLRHDIELYKHMAEKIEREIESFYDKYTDVRYKKENEGKIYYKHVTNTVNHQKETWKLEDPKENKFPYSRFYNITNGLASRYRINEDNTAKVASKNHLPEKLTLFNSPWPKFEDILLAMGKKYDWKNDRWIKVKEKKFKKSDIKDNPSVIHNNSIEFHEKHKFSYRIVKLSKSKSRRNVVVAVSAVR